MLYECIYLTYICKYVCIADLSYNRYTYTLANDREL